MKRRSRPLIAFEPTINFGYGRKPLNGSQPDTKRCSSVSNGIDAYQTPDMYGSNNDAPARSTVAPESECTTGTFAVSKDGKTAILTTKGTGEDGKPFAGTTAYEKQ